MVVWPVSALRVAAKAYAELYAAIRDQSWTRPLLDRMQTRADLYETIGYHNYEAHRAIGGARRHVGPLIGGKPGGGSRSTRRR